jgi:hypothetical protein
MLTVTTAAADRTLLTLAEIRSATGVSGTTYNDDLTTLNSRVAAALARACRLASGGVSPPTFRAETLTEVFRQESSEEYLILSRRPATSITSVVEDTTTLDTDEYEVDIGTGLLYRLDGDDSRIHWAATKITVVYVAGWATVPDDLKLAAAKFARILWTEEGPDAREPGLKREEIAGATTLEYWVAPASDPLMSAEIAELLADYRENGGI